MKAPRIPTRLTRWAASVLLAAGVTLSFCLAWLVQLGQEHRGSQNVATLAENMAREIGNDIAAYGTILRGLHGLFISSTEVDRDEFRQYVGLLRLQHDAALLQRFSFVKREGNAFVVKYVEPLAGNEALLGTDIADFPPTRDALARVMAGGNLTLSAPYRMERGSPGDTGLILYLPVYDSGDPARPYAATGRRTVALVGITINLEKSLRNIAEPLVQRHVYLKLTELEQTWAAAGETNGQPFFDSAAGAAMAAPAWLTASRELKVLGNRWRLDLAAEPDAMPPATRYAPQLTLALTLTLTLLLYLLVRTLGRVGALATDLAEKTTAELRQSEARLALALEAAEAGLWDFDPVARTTYFSPRFGDLLGYPDAQALKEVFFLREALHPEDRERVLAAQEAALRAGTRFDETYRLRRKDGAYRWFRGIGYAYRDEARQAIRYPGLLIDVTAQREAEQALRESQTQLIEAQAVARLGSWHLDIVANHLVWSPETYRLFGIATGTPLSYELFISRIHPDDRALVESNWAAALEGAPYDIEHRIVVDGGVHWVREQAKVIFDAQGQPVSGIGTVLDITERRQTDERLRLAATVFEHSLEGVTITDGEGTILAVNGAFGRITGYGPEDAIGRNPRLLQSGRHGPDFYRAMWDAIRAQGYWRGEVWNKRKNGEIYPELLGICAVPDGDGRPSHYVGMFTDISELKRSEAAMRQFNAELERRVAERTAALTASNKELEAFSYSVSHDLRAPLRAIDGFSRVIAEDYADRLDDAAQEHLARIRAASQRMATVIDDMLELARIVRLEPERQDVDLSALAAVVCEELPEDPDRRVELVIAPNVHAQADPRLMHIVLQNLLHNAWKFTSRTEAARIEFGETAVAGERAFFVRDNGAGFDPAHSKNLFGAFQRLHRPDEFAGSGIGLATVQRTVQRHGGRVWAESAVGQGATFYFTLG